MHTVFYSFYISTDISESLNTSLSENFPSNLSNWSLEGGDFSLQERNNGVISAGLVDPTGLEGLLSITPSAWETTSIQHREKIKKLDTDLFWSAILLCPFHGSA